MTNNKELTKKQKYVYDKIVEYFSKYNQSPTIDELREMTGYTTLGSIANFLKKIEDKGYIKRKKNIPRGISLVKEEKFQDKEVPVIEQLNIMEDVRKQYMTTTKKIKLDRSIIPETNRPVFCLIAQDMAIDGINIGTLLFVENTDTLNKGDIGILIYNDMLILRYWIPIDNEKVLLKSDNKIYADITEDINNIQIVGRLLSFYTKLPV